MTAAADDLALPDLPRLLRTADGWADVRAALARGESGTIDGAWGSSAALAAAALAEEGGCLLVVVPGVADAGLWAEDLATFLGRRPTVFPAFETWPPPTDKGRLLPEAAERLRVLQALASSSPLP